MSYGILPLLLLALVWPAAVARAQHGTPGLPKVSLGTPRPLDACAVPEQGALSDGNLREVVDSLFSASHLHAGSGAAVADLLGGQMKNAASAERVARELGAAWKRVGGLEGAPDRGQFLAVWGETAAKLAADHPLLKDARDKLHAAAKIASGAEAMKAAWQGEQGHPVLATARSAIAGLQALGAAGKLGRRERELLASLPLVEAGTALAASLEGAEPEERGALIRSFIGTIEKSPLSRAPYAALKSMARYLDKRTASDLGTVLESSLKKAASNPQGFDADLLGVVQEMSRSAIDAGARAVAREVLEKRGLLGKNGAQNIGKLVSTVRAGLVAAHEKDGKEADRLFREIAQTALDIGLDIGGIVDPTPICDGINCVRAIRRGDYVSAALSAISMLPYLGDGVVKPLKLGGAAAKVIRLAAKAERVLAKIAYYERRIDQIVGLAQAGIAVAKSVSQGQLPDAASALQIAEAATAGRKGLPQALRLLRTLATASAEQNALSPPAGPGPTVACARPNAIQRAATSVMSWLRRPFVRFQSRHEPTFRGQSPDDEAPTDLPSLAEERMRTMAFTPPQRASVQQALRARPDMTRHELLELLLTTKFPT